MTEPVVSIIIPTFNRNELLKYGLTSISKQVTAFPYEIIILNEYIDDESSILAKQFNARYIITRPEMTKETVSWRCPGYAINHGVKQAKGEYIIIACPEICSQNRQVCHKKKRNNLKHSIGIRQRKLLKIIYKNTPLCRLNVV